MSMITKSRRLLNYHQIDCEWVTFGEWSPCSQSCVGGTMSRSRYELAAIANGGHSSTY